MKTLIKLEDLEELVVASIDHGSKINLMSKKLYNKKKWHIDIEHGWIIRIANNSKKDLYGACPNIKMTIRYIIHEQFFFVQDMSTYPIILG